MAVVLDLDSTLIHSEDEFKEFKKLNILNDPQHLAIRQNLYFLKLSDKVEGIKYDYWGIKRPHLDEFLLFCFNYFKYVIVYSAGSRNYVDELVRCLFKTLRPPHLVWAHEDVVYKNKQPEKPLTKIISQSGLKGLSLEKMIVIDDNENTFVHNVRNAIHIPPFEPQTTIAELSRDDQCLLQIKYWLLLPNHLSATDVRKLDMESLFDYSAEEYKTVANEMYIEN
jgi:TFIIF-interacting CTD phosphatase-like protein